MARLPVPIVVTITGEGGSGGALAIAVGDQVNMLENSVYSVISPEGCASILWRDAAKAEVAAEALKITARDLKEFGIIDEIVPEPEGGAHLDHEASAALLGSVLDDSLRDLSRLTIPELLDRRYEKFRRMGQFFEAARINLTCASAFADRGRRPACSDAAVFASKSIAGFAPPCSIFIVAPRLLVIILEDGDRPLMSKQTGPQVSETAASNGTTQVFRPYERLVEIKVLGKDFPGPGKEHDSSLLPVHQPGNHPVRAFLLESGLPILPRRRKTHR